MMEDRQPDIFSKYYKYVVKHLSYLIDMDLLIIIQLKVILNLWEGNFMKMV